MRHCSFGQQTLVSAFCIAGIDTLDVIRLVPGHHLIAAHAVSDGMHDGPLPGGGFPAALGFFSRQGDDFAPAQIHLQRAIRWGEAEKLHELFTRTREIRRGVIALGQESPEPNFGRDRGKH